ncbi:MAG: pantoate--beta-alanine ligase, partial [Sneathiella sp.]
VRESDGLALSSRNAYLSEEERAIASKLHHTLRNIAQAVTENQNMENSVSIAIDDLKAAGFNAVDYLAVRDANTLQIVKDHDQPIRVLVAATLGKTRLIDNIAV